MPGNRHSVHGPDTARKCIFILKDKVSEGGHMGKGVPGILGMNIISELKELLLPREGTRRTNHHGHSKKNTVLSRVLARAEGQNRSLSSTGQIGNVKVGEKQKTFPCLYLYIPTGRIIVSATILRKGN